MNQKLAKLPMPFAEALARIARTPKSAIGAVEAQTQKPGSNKRPRRASRAKAA